MGRRPVPKHLKKKPSDYPQLAFRLSQQDKEKLQGLVEDATESLNRHRKPDSEPVMKGDVIIQALYLGLKQLSKKHRS